MRNKFIFLYLLLFSVSSIINGQKQVNTPYSRFNLGTLEPVAPFKSLGMGGLSMGLRDNTNIFFSNPASYSSIDTTSFIFDFGIDYSITQLRMNDASHTSDDMNFDHMIFGFPIARGFGVGMGMVPFSNGYYLLQDKTDPSSPGYDPLIGSYTSSHAGEGGINQFFAGAGYQINKYISAGINLNILLGQIRRSNEFFFDDQLVYHNNSSEFIRIMGVNLDYGLQFTLPYGTRRFFNAGVSFTPASSFKTDYENYVYRYTSFGNSDTISFVSGGENKVRLPGVFRAGIAVGQTGKFTAGIDFIAANWAKANIPGSESSMANTQTFILGLEFTPERFSNFNYLKRMDYRLGGHIGNNYLVINGDQVKEMGVSAGFGLPMKRGSLSKANIFVDYTRKYGPGSDILPTEHFMTVGASINLYDFWFFKRKYD